MAKTAKIVQKESLEKKFWKAANKLRKNMDAGEFKHVVFLNGLVNLVGKATLGTINQFVKQN